VVDDATNALNLGSAENLARINIGIDSIDPSDWTQDERVQYLKQVASLIVTYPNEFNTATLTSAQQLLQHPDQDLSNSISDMEDQWNTFTYTLAQGFESNIAEPASQVGQAMAQLVQNAATVVNKGSSALASAASISSWALPVAAVAVLFLILRDPERGTQAGKNLAGGVRELLPY